MSSDRRLVFNFKGYSGLDILLMLLPKSWQTRRVARAWLRALTPTGGGPPDLKKTDVVVQMPWGSFKVVDHSGNVEPCATEHVVNL